MAFNGQMHRLLLFLLLITPPAIAQEPPPGLTEYMGRQIAMTMHWKGAEWLMRRVREKEESPTITTTPVPYLTRA